MLADYSHQYQKWRGDEFMIEREPHTSRWLLRWLTCKPAVPDHDGEMGKFQDCEIAPPQIQIPGIQSMLQNRTRNPICDWGAKIFDCFRYLVSLDVRAQGHEPWYRMLQDTLDWIKPDVLIVMYEKELNQAQLHSPAAPPGGNHRFSHLLRPNHPIQPLTPQRGNTTEQNKLDPRKVKPMLPKFRSDHGEVTNNPLFETGGPWRLTAINTEHLAQEENWALSTREHAIKTYKECLKSAEEGEQPVMPMPDNWNGPVEVNMMDEDMKKTWNTLRKHQKLVQQLKAVERRLWGRPLISEIVKKIEEGKTGVPWPQLGLQFRDYEFLSGNTGPELRPIGPEEGPWLWYLCWPLHHDRMLPQEYDYEGSHKVFWDRIAAWLGDRNPYERAVQTSEDYFSKEEIMSKLNRGLRGPVERLQLEEVEPIVWRDTEMRNVLQGSATEEYYSVRREHLHPEHAIRWPGPQQDVGNNDEDDKWEAYKQFLHQAEDQLLTTEHVAQMAQDAPLEIRNQEEQTRSFFCRLAYRLGYTIHILTQKHKQDLERLGSRSRREASRQSLAKALDIWKRTCNQETDIAQVGSRKRRRASTYRDIVREHVPYQFRQNWDGDPTSDIEAECAQVVRKGVILELSNNRSNVQIPCKRRRREAPWTFGHSSMKPRARQFWDINRWDPHQPPRQPETVIEPAGSDVWGSPIYRSYRPGSPDDSPGATGQRQRATGNGQEIVGVGEQDRQLNSVRWYNHLVARIFSWLNPGVEGRVEEESASPLPEIEEEPTHLLPGIEGEPANLLPGSEESTESSGQSDKENRVQRTLWPTPDRSPVDDVGGQLGTVIPLQDVTAIHEPGAESDVDLYGVSDREDGDPENQDQQEQFDIYVDPISGELSSEAAETGAAPLPQDS